jgi:hypothetical protein
MDWRGPTPDPLVGAFLASDRLLGLSGEAMTCFFNTLGVVSGPMYVAFEGELERAKSWQSSLVGAGAEAWIDELVAAYEERIREQRIRDEEFEVRWR